MPEIKRKTSFFFPWIFKELPDLIFCRDGAHFELNVEVDLHLYLSMEDVQFQTQDPMGAQTGESWVRCLERAALLARRAAFS